MCDRIAARQAGIASGGAVAAGIWLLCDWIVARRVGLHGFGVRCWLVTGRGATGGVAFCPHVQYDFVSLPHNHRGVVGLPRNNRYVVVTSRLYR